ARVPIRAPRSLTRHSHTGTTRSGNLRTAILRTRTRRRRTLGTAAFRMETPRTAAHTVTPRIARRPGSRHDRTRYPPRDSGHWSRPTRLRDRRSRTVRRHIRHRRSTWVAPATSRPAGHRKGRPRGSRGARRSRGYHTAIVPGATRPPSGRTRLAIL